MNKVVKLMLKKINWFASAWDIDSQKFLRGFNFKFNKIASAMLTNLDLLKNILVNQDFKNNKVHTNFFENNVALLTDLKTHADLSDINRSIPKDQPKRGKIENLDP